MTFQTRSIINHPVYGQRWKSNVYPVWSRSFFRLEFVSPRDGQHPQKLFPPFIRLHYRPLRPPSLATRRTLIWIGPKKLRQLIITFCGTYRARNIWPNCGKWLIRVGGRRGVSNLCRPFAVDASIRLEWQIIN